MTKILRKLIGLDKPLAPGIRTGTESIICPFCGELHATFRVINSMKQPIDKYKYKFSEESIQLPRFLITSENESIIYQKDKNTFLKSNNQLVYNSETFKFINRIDEVTKSTIEQKRMLNIPFEYICVPQNVNIYRGSQRINNACFEICSVCGLEIKKNIPKRTVYFLGGRSAGKTTIIYYIMSLFNKINFPESYDSLYWEQVYDEGKNGEVAATDVIQSPPLYINIKSHEFCIMDIAGEKIDDLVYHIQHGTICLTIALDIMENKELNVTSIRKAINEITIKIHRIKSNNVKYNIIFTKYDNLYARDNRRLFNEEIANSSEIKQLSDYIDEKNFIFADPRPKNYPDSNRESKEMENLIKHVFR